MRNKINLLFCSIILVTASLLSCTEQQSINREKFDQIEKGFTTPQDTNKIWCYYYWINDDISKEGVTKDLEAMKEFGFGAVLIGNINPDEVDGPVPLFSDKWWEVMVHVVEEGHRIGIDIGFFNCPGWSQSGGPWITYDKAMRHLVYSETIVDGAGEKTAKLEKPEPEFQDSYVLAFKNIKEQKRSLSAGNAKITTDPSMQNVKNLIDNKTETSSLFELDKYKEYTLNISANEPIDAKSIWLHPASPGFKCQVKLFAKSENDYELIESFIFDRSRKQVNTGPVVDAPLAIALTDIHSSDYKIVITNMQSNRKNAGFSEIIISEIPVLEAYVEKSLGQMHQTPLPTYDSYMWESQDEIKNKELVVNSVINLSDKMDDSGILQWDVPEGSWTVLRLGMTPTGTKNSPAAPQGKGYEVDKANEELIRFHFDQFMGEILKRVPDESKPALKYVIADSYEMGSQNWTDGYEEKFEAKNGYSPVEYLPVLSGRIVHSVEESDRFLWDLRRAIADDIAYEYVGGLRKISNEHGLKLWLENYGHWGFPGEFLMYGGQSNLVSGEFWNEGNLGNIECKSASSAAHIYGKPIISAEAFTASNQAYKRHPALLKKRGDWSFTEGINHFVLHLYIQQPDDKRIPGINAWFSTEFNRHNTWFKHGKAWANYLRRSQNLLQQGKYVADVLYFIGEDTPKMTGVKNPELPDGYSYDYVNAEVILERLSVKNGKYVLPDGMEYSLLVLPEITTMRPEVLKKLEQFVEEGGTILGPKPEKSPSLENYPECDQQVKELADQLWISDSDEEMIYSYGEGMVLDNTGIKKALELIRVPEDVIFDSEAPVLWTHRTLPGMEIYFLTNQGNETITFNPSFRVEGLKPQLWDAVTGAIRQLNEFTVENGRTTVPLKMEKHQSWYIVFTNMSNENVSEGYAQNFPEPKVLKTISGIWNVDFYNRDIGPEGIVEFETLYDWTESESEMIKYYSGTAKYTINFEIDEVPENTDLMLNLGNVNVMGNAVLNGEDLGTAWIHPYYLPVKGNLKTGTNTLEIEVVNLWRNHLIKEDDVPQAERYTWLTVEDVKPDEELHPSGLIGPVTIEIIE
jgi:hypothetical protein